MFNYKLLVSPLIFPRSIPRTAVWEAWLLRNLFLAKNAGDSLAEFLLHPQGYSSLWQRLLQKEHPHHPVLSQRWELPVSGERDNVNIRNCLRTASLPSMASQTSHIHPPPFYLSCCPHILHLIWPDTLYSPSPPGLSFYPQ